LAREQRRLAAILAADVVSYSRLMGRDESGTLARLKGHRSERLDPALARNGGRLVKLTGDGALAEFGSAVDALRAAIEFQQAMAESNDGKPEDHRIVFRIGLHLGDLIVDENDLYGDGVNIAARLEAQAQPGGIAISSDIHNAVAGKLKATLLDLGVLPLKNIERPVQAFAVAWLAEDWSTPRAASPPASAAPAPPKEAAPTFALPDKPSVAVLPFQNLNGDPDQEYFGDGVTEDIITALSRFRELLVISRGSSFAFKGKGLSVRQIAQHLDVRYVLSGSVRKVSGRLRATAELTDAESGVQIWTDRYDRDLIDMFDLQDELSRTVAAVVQPAVRGAEIERARRKPPADLSAYDLYLRALPHVWAVTRDEIPKAIQLLQQSVSVDATSTPALAALAWCLVWASPAGADASLRTRAEALSLARSAVQQDSNDAFAQAVYGIVLSMSDEHDLALLHAREAVRLNPSSAFAWGAMGMVGTWCGDFESAVKSLDRAIGLSPYDTLLFVWTTWLTSAYFALRRYEEGIAWARRAVQHNPNFGTAHRLLAANLVLAERLEEAREVTRKRNAVQMTTIREIRAMRLFQQEEVAERYLSAQRMAGISE